MSKPYVLHPTVYRDSVVFCAEEDLWQVDLSGGLARRLTTGRGAFSTPKFSPDGRWIAAVSQDEGGREVALLPADGGELRRLTYLGSPMVARVCGWEDGATVLMASAHRHPHWAPEVFRVRLAERSIPEPLNLGPANYVAFSKAGVVVEHGGARSDPAWWKGYRGGLAGKFFIAPRLDGEFRPLVPFVNANLSTPLWIKDRLFFVADVEDVAQIYSCDAAGRDVRQHTRMREFYARGPSTDGRTLVFHAGGDLFALDLRSNRTREIKVSCPSQRPQRQRKVVSAAQGFESFSISKDGHELALTWRGQVATLEPWRGTAKVVTKGSDHRYRLATFVGDSKGLVWVSDEGGAEHLVYRASPDGELRHYRGLDVGRVLSVTPSPTAELVALTNNRNELLILDLKTRKVTHVDRDEWGPLWHVPAFSPDGRFLAYGCGTGRRTSVIRVYDLRSKKRRDVTRPFLKDLAPHFDPEGRYLYLVTNRDLDPYRDSAQLNFSFPRTSLAALLTLRKDVLSPFAGPQLDAGDKATKKAPEKSSGKVPAKLRFEIDFDGIEDRLLSFPFRPAGHVVKIAGLDRSRVLVLLWPIEGTLSLNWLPAAPETKGRLEVFDFATQKLETFLEGVSDFSVVSGGKSVLVRAGNRLRLYSSDGGMEKASQETGPKGGWIDLDRAQTLMEPAGEWRQMLGEIWRLQRDHFWDPGMSRIDWAKVLARYKPLVDRVSSRSEFSDLVWEMQGELGTSHAYDIGGDYRSPPPLRVGQLGADFEISPRGYRVSRIPRGDSWSPDGHSPLAAPGVLVRPGDEIVSVDGRDLALEPLGRCLLNKVGVEVELGVLSKGAKKPRLVRVKTYASDLELRYRDWVATKIELVARLSKGRLGYIHVPDMSSPGFSEFHRHFLRDFDCDGLVVDFRFNGGGNVSALLIEKLARTRLGFGRTRWFKEYAFPDEAPTGVMVGITNEFAGSDGDIGPHQFKMRRLGLLVGKRSWGGVVGIWPRQPLVDGSFTTQPEFAHWFKDVGWDLENHGTVPDIEVDILPHEHRLGLDPQLERAVELALQRLESEGVWRPEVTETPDRRRGLTKSRRPR